MDTFRGNSFDPQSLHKYAYCHADPINLYDPSGFESGSLGEKLVTFAIFAINAAFLLYDLNKAFKAKTPGEHLEADFSVALDILGFFTGPGPRVGMMATTQMGKQLALRAVYWQGGKLAVANGLKAIAGRWLWQNLLMLSKMAESGGAGGGGSSGGGGGSMGSNEGDDIALGVGENLDNFANAVGGKTYEEWGAKNFEESFFKICEDSANRIHMNLTGPMGEYISPWTAARNPAESITNWEISEIYKHPEWWDRVTFYFNGKPIPFPFR